MKTNRLILISVILFMAEILSGQENMNSFINVPFNHPVPGINQMAAKAESNDIPAQPVSDSWRDRHQVQLSIGLLSGYGVETGTWTGGLENSAGGRGLLGSIAYSYWFRDDFAVGASIGMIGSEVSSSINGSRIFLETGSVVPVLFGIRYSPLKMAGSESVRFSVFALAGPCVGSATRSFSDGGLELETYSETVPASRFGVGADLVLGRIFMTGLSAGYYLAADFDRPIGAQKNYSSPEFALSFGILLGSG